MIVSHTFGRGRWGSFSREPVDEDFGDMSLFAGCSRRQLRQAATLMTSVPAAAGVELIRQGTTGREFVIVTEGIATVDRDGATIDEVGAGDFVGEISLLTSRPRTASITMATDGRVAVLNRQEFATLRVIDDGIDDQITTAARRRLEGLP